MGLPAAGTVQEVGGRSYALPVLQAAGRCGLNTSMGHQVVSPEAEDGSAPVLPADFARSSHQSASPDAAGMKQPEMDAISDDYRVGYNRTCGCFAEVSPWAAKVRCQGVPRDALSPTTRMQAQCSRVAYAAYAISLAVCLIRWTAQSPEMLDRQISTLPPEVEMGALWHRWLLPYLPTSSPAVWRRCRSWEPRSCLPCNAVDVFHRLLHLQRRQLDIQVI